MKRGALPTEAPEAEACLANGNELRKRIAGRKLREQAVKNPSLIVGKRSCRSSTIEQRGKQPLEMVSPRVRLIRHGVER